MKTVATVACLIALVLPAIAAPAPPDPPGGQYEIIATDANNELLGVICLRAAPAGQSGVRAWFGIESGQAVQIQPNLMKYFNGYWGRLEGDGYKLHIWGNNFWPQGTPLGGGTSVAKDTWGSFSMVFAESGNNWNGYWQFWTQTKTIPLGGHAAALKLRRPDVCEPPK